MRLFVEFLESFYSPRRAIRDVRNGDNVRNYVCEGARQATTENSLAPTQYVDKGMAYCEMKYRQNRINWIMKQAEALNLQLVPAKEVTR